MGVVAKTSPKYMVEILIFATREKRSGSKIFSEEAEGEALVNAAHPTKSGDGRSFKRERMEPGFRRVEAEVREIFLASGSTIVFKIVIEFGAANRETERVEVRKRKERVYKDALDEGFLGEEVGPIVFWNPNVSGNPYETDGSVELG